MGALLWWNAGGGMWKVEGRIQLKVFPPSTCPLPPNPPLGPSTMSYLPARKATDGSQNMCMAKQLKPIEGHIAQINAPRFAEDRNMWVMIVYS
jgi:hypothetical protein